MEKPILFNTAMVQAILKGDKTSTRRPMKKQPLDCSDKVMDHRMNLKSFFEDEPNEFACTWCGNGVGMDGHSIFKAPYAKGDTLWVRETWNALDADWKHPGNHFVITEGPWPNIIYKADSIHKFSWIPSIHMQRWAARIFLKVTDVRIERLQDITEDRAFNEGVKGIRCSCKGQAYACTDCYNTGWQEPPTLHFLQTWDSIYKNWDENPWVWVIEFEKI